MHKFTQRSLLSMPQRSMLSFPFLGTRQQLNKVKLYKHYIYYRYMHKFTHQRSLLSVPQRSTTVCQVSPFRTWQYAWLPRALWASSTTTHLMDSAMQVPRLRSLVITCGVRKNTRRSRQAF